MDEGIIVILLKLVHGWRYVLFVLSLLSMGKFYTNSWNRVLCRKLVQIVRFLVIDPEGSLFLQELGTEPR